MSGTNLPDALKLADQLKSRYGNAVPTSQAAAVLRDQAGRIAYLTTKEFDLAAANAALLERVRTLEGDNQRLEAERDKAQMLADGNGADAYAHCCDSVEAWRRKRGHEMSGPEGTLCGWVDWAMAAVDERDDLRARLDAAAGQEPVPPDDYPFVDGPLYSAPVPAQAVPDGWRLLAWAHEDGRVIGAETMETARRDGGATLSSVKGYTIPLYAAPEAAR